MFDRSSSVSLRSVTFIGQSAFQGKSTRPVCLVVLVWWDGLVYAVVVAVLDACMHVVTRECSFMIFLFGCGYAGRMESLGEFMSCVLFVVICKDIPCWVRLCCVVLYMWRLGYVVLSI